MSPETKAKIALAMVGRKTSPEARARMSEAAQRRGAPRKAIAASAEARRGKPLSAEHRATLAWTPERVAKQSTAMKGNSMAGHFTPEGRAALARAVTRRHQAKERTALEQAVAQELFAFGVAYEQQHRIDGDPFHAWDFVMPAHRLLIEADGCYWHGCELCGHPGLRENRRNDKAKDAMARKLGWRLVRIKECGDVKDQLASVFAGL